MRAKLVYLFEEVGPAFQREGFDLVLLGCGDNCDCYFRQEKDARLAVEKFGWRDLGGYQIAGRQVRAPMNPESAATNLAFLFPGMETVKSEWYQLQE